MALLHATPLASERQAPPIVSELERVFAVLEDNDLISTLTGPVRRGPKGYPLRVLWQCFIAKHVLGIESTAALLRALLDNPYLADACGLTRGVPSEATMSRFFAKLSYSRTQHLLKNVSRRLVNHHYATLPGFGRIVAIDSTVLKGWSNGGKPKKAAPEASWAVKKNTQGKTEFTYGWKLHLMVCSEYELPISAIVSTHDVTKATSMLSEARFTNSRFRPSFVLADKGYSSDKLRHAIRQNYHSQPVIDPNPQHKKAVARTVKDETWSALYRLRPAVERAYSRLQGSKGIKQNPREAS